MSASSCSKCGNTLADDGSAERSACPVCGRASRTYKSSHHEVTTIGASAELIHGRPGLDGSLGEINDRGVIRTKLTGRSPRKEEGAMETCERLVEHLNSLGATWADLRPETRGDVDGEATDAGGHKLEIQVVRASDDGEMWAELNREGSVERQSDADTLADQLLRIVVKKSSRYPSRKDLTLAIDAGQLTAHTFQQTRDNFRERHAAACAASGFKDVWLVGPRADLTYRLDE